MKHASIRQKGQQAERQICEYFNTILPQLPPLFRNLDQTRGNQQYDLFFILDTASELPYHFYIEVKHHANITQASLQNFWQQILSAANYAPTHTTVPVVAFKKNRSKFEFLIPAKFVLQHSTQTNTDQQHPDQHFIQLTEPVFRLWIQGL